MYSSNSEYTTILSIQKDLDTSGKGEYVCEEEKQKKKNKNNVVENGEKENIDGSIT